MQIGAPISQPTYRIFLSSGQDAADLRDRVDGLVRDSINSQLLEAEIDLRVEVDRWERSLAKKNNPGENLNDQFVKRALRSNLTLALLLDELGGGTREELEATLAAEREVSALWFIPQQSSPDSPVAKFLGEKRRGLLYSKTGEPDSHDSWSGIVRVLFALILEGLKQTHGGLQLSREGLHVERR